MAVRILLGKIGIDGHDRGVRTLAYGLRQAGFEVIYTGPWQPVEAIVRAAVQEDVDVIGISTLGGDYLLIPKLMEKLRERGAEIPVIVGGIVPPNEERRLKELGVREVFHPGSTMESIVGFLRRLASERSSSGGASIGMAGVGETVPAGN